MDELQGKSQLGRIKKIKIKKMLIFLFGKMWYTKKGKISRKRQNTENGKKEYRMNVLFFLTPKSEIAFIEAEATLRQALERLENTGYTALPILNKEGKYIGTITEGDMLWYIKSQTNLTLIDAEDVPLLKVKRRRDNQAVSVNEEISGLWDKVINQNFVPVTDDDNTFIGIVTRKDIMVHLKKKFMADKK